MIKNMENMKYMDGDYIGYETKRLLSVLEFDSNTKIEYIIKTFLNLMYHNDEIEIHVLKKVDGD